jgi:hypothetical protein
MNTDQKRCENCKKLFGRRVLADGRLEYPSNFKLRLYCSRSCSSTARLSRKMVRDAAVTD